MNTWLVVLTVFEIVLALGIISGYLIAIARRLNSISTNLGKVAFGVRAIESQTAAIGPAATKLNSELEAITGALPAIAHAAEGLAAKAT